MRRIAPGIKKCQKKGSIRGSNTGPLADCSEYSGWTLSENHTTRPTEQCSDHGGIVSYIDSFFPFSIIYKDASKESTPSSRTSGSPRSERTDLNTVALHIFQTSAKKFSAFNYICIKLTIVLIPSLLIPLLGASILLQQLQKMISISRSKYLKR